MVSPRVSGRDRIGIRTVKWKIPESSGIFESCDGRVLVGALFDRRLK
jgi:hypothetical protein